MDTITVTTRLDERTGQVFVQVVQHTDGYSPEDDACIYLFSREEVEQLAVGLIDALDAWRPAAAEYGYA